MNKNNSDISVLIQKATRLHQAGKLTEAIAEYNKLAKNFPSEPGIFVNKGIAYGMLNNPSEALLCFDRALEIDPSDVGANFNKAIALKEMKQFNEAIKILDLLLSIEPNNITYYILKGKFLSEINQNKSALDAYDQAAIIDSNCMDMIFERANLYFKMDNYQKAEEGFNKVTILKTNYLDAWLNLGNSQAAQEKYEESLRSYDKAIELEPNYFLSHFNKAKVLASLGRFDQADEGFKKVILLNPTFPETYYGLATTRLIKGDFDNGWRGYESRKIQLIPAGNRQFPAPVWTGAEDLENKSIFIHHEQGLGDTIQFCRYIKELNSKKANVIFMPQKQLIPLMKTMKSNVEIIESEHSINKIDFHCPLLSLPLAFQTDLNSIPNDTPYLFANENRKIQWRKRLGTDGFKIGINWQGQKGQLDIGRSFPVSLFKKISEISSIRLISLNKSDDYANKIKSKIDFEIEYLGPDFDEYDTAFMDSAAVIMNCDLVITSDTSTAHLAGALGAPTWVALKKYPDWRWMLNQSISPWYPSMRLFRQKEIGDWVTVFSEIEKEVRKILN